MQFLKIFYSIYLYVGTAWRYDTPAVTTVQPMGQGRVDRTLEWWVESSIFVYIYIYLLFIYTENDKVVANMLFIQYRSGFYRMVIVWVIRYWRSRLEASMSTSLDLEHTAIQLLISSDQEQFFLIILDSDSYFHFRFR